ncbi:uncharacterized protein [Ptychodera flava]|uniref:uncharacterized protein n=1 Tax=Ptychodera flava TaxID=63121 RepID=UPI003969FE61
MVHSIQRKPWKTKVLTDPINDSFPKANTCNGCRIETIRGLKLLFLLLAAFLHPSSPVLADTEAESVLVEMPTDVCVEENRRAVMKCSVRGPYEPVWRKEYENGTIITVSDGYNVYYKACKTCTFSDEPKPDQYNLIIYPVSLNDAHEWICELFQAQPHFHKARLFIAIPCLEAKMNVIRGATYKSEKTYKTEEGTNVTLQCIASGCEAPCLTVTWYKDNSPISSDSDSPSEITILVSRDDHMKKILCSVGNNATNERHEDHVTLIVQFEGTSPTSSTQASHSGWDTTKHEPKRDYNTSNDGSAPGKSLSVVSIVVPLSLAAVLITR